MCVCASVYVRVSVCLCVCVRVCLRVSQHMRLHGANDAVYVF